MPMLTRGDCSLFYDVHDLTPPWVENAATIVFHHGVGINADIWIEWLPALARRYRIVRFDTRGFGSSTAPGKGYPWSLDMLVEDVIAVAGAAGVEQFHLVGESLGGTVAMALAAKHPQAVHSLTVCSAAHRGGGIQRVREWREFIGRKGMEAWSDQMMGLRFTEGAVPRSVYRWFDRVQGASSADSVLDLADLLIGTDLSSALLEIRAPTLLLAPDGSPFVPVAIPLEIRERIPNCELKILPGAGHVCQMEQPWLFDLYMIEFLTRHGHFPAMPPSSAETA